MTKITSGLIGSIVAIAVVAGTGLALIVDSVTLSNISLAAGNVDLEIAATAGALPGTGDLDLDGFATTLVPGEVDTTAFVVRNTNTEDVNLALTGSLNPDPTTQTDWTALMNLMEVAIHTDVDPTDGATSTGWVDLETWLSTPQTLPGGDLTPNVTRDYNLSVRLRPDADETVMGKSLSNLGFTIDGTQVL